jgi:hypothetical protein
MSEVIIPWADEEARAVGLPDDWRALGFDSPEYMQSIDSVYHVRNANDQPTGTYKCVWPKCNFRRRDLRAMFRHVHDPKLHDRPGQNGSPT